ncbi:hypothetical protein [Actinoplanes flavus]|uniref:Secreted protein n=1 Tax=Actinoplanes flavus TaxID=2820290 RepID=A0ABS3UP17_9ACTN|nr:hypothetical protein [Actinoplanes flavus]MBO3740529.1 hypothetical protein [Actinoplanes flavus]
MRSAILAVLAGGMLLGSAACGSDPKPSSAPQPTTSARVEATPLASPSAPDYSADNDVVCRRLDKVFTAGFGDFGKAIGKMIAYKEAKDKAGAAAAEKTAAAELQAVATDLRKEVATAKNPDLKASAIISVGKIETSAKNRDYIEKIKTTKDLDKSLKAQIAEWLSPVAGYCAIS